MPNEIETKFDEPKIQEVTITILYDNGQIDSATITELFKLKINHELQKQLKRSLFS